ncbi:MAG: Sapep family Mn(2+)-dependent dipeptidase [Clostridia bacterium]|nr:Sapep family Mn(2+)-dependent dipeptidase [Clostridia bacterium]
MNQELITRIDEWLNAHRDDMVNEIMELTRIPSVRSEAKPGAPFGENCRKAVDAAKELCERHGFAAEVRGDGAYALMHSGDGPKSIGLFSHVDVVPEGNGWEITEPYNPIEREGFLVGRGVCDNKNGVVTGLYAIKAIRELGLPVKSRLTLFMGGDEESGMEDAQLFAKTETMPDFSLVPDTEFPVCHGEKGIFKAWGVANAKSEAILSLSGGLAYNVVCDEVKATLKNLPGLADELTAALKGNEWVSCEVKGDEIEVTAKGVSAHASVPEKGHNATWELGKALASVQALPEVDRAAMAKIAAVLADGYGEAIGVAHTDEQSGPLTCANGMVALRDGCVAISFDVRYCVTLDGTEVEAGFKKCFEPDGWHLEDLSYSNGYHIPVDDPCVQALYKVYLDVTGDTEAKPYTMGGGTYARRLKNAVAFGPEPRIGLRPSYVPKSRGGAHQPDEVLCVETFIEGIRIFILGIMELDTILNG